MQIIVKSKTLIFFARFLTALSFLVFSYSNASENAYIPLSIDQGLSQATANTIVQDKSGYIWIGTQDGLNRYDGYRFTQYKHDPNNAASLSHSFINKLVADETGNLWILTAAGIDRYDHETESFVHYHDKRNSEDFFNKLYLWSMRNGKNNNLWITSANGIIEFNKKTGTYHHFEAGKKYGLVTKNTYDIGIFDREKTFDKTHFDNSSNNIIATDNGIFKQVKIQSKNAADSPSITQYRFKSVTLKHLTNSKKEPKVHCISNQKFNLFFACSRDGLYFNHKNQYHYISNAELGINAHAHRLLITNTKELWIGTVNGLYIKSLDLDHLLNSLQKRQGVTLPNQAIHSLYEDNSNVIWVGTNISGVVKIIPTARTFNHFSATTQSHQQLSNNSITSVAQSPQGDIWVGDSKGGISIISTNNQVAHLSLKDNQGTTLYNNILGFEFDLEGNIWIANTAGISKLSADKKRQTTYQLQDPSLTQQTYATQVFKTNDSRLWLTGLESGLNQYYPTLKQFIPIRPLNWPEKKPFAALTYTAMVDSETIWMAGFQGTLYKYNLFTRSANQYRMSDENNHKLGVSQIYGMAKDNSNNIWVVGMGGIGKFSINDQKFTYLASLKGFSSQTYYSVTKDNQGYMWTTSGDKLIRINPQDYSSLSFDRAMGMPIIEFSPASHIDESGNLWLGGLNGLVSFNPQAITVPQKKTTPILTGVESKYISEKEPTQNIWSRITLGTKSSLIVKPTKSTLRLSFASLDSNSNSSIRYRHRLTNYDETWNTTIAGNPRATYTRIPHGEYSFQVATSFDGINWSEPTNILDIEVLPFFWQSLWFQLLIACLLATALKLIFLWKARRIRSHANKLEKIVQHRTEEISMLLEQRTRFFTFVSHELKTPLTLVQDPLNKLVNNPDDNSNKLLSTALRNVNKMSSMVNRLLTSVDTIDIQQKQRLRINQKILEAVSQLSEFAQQYRISLITKKLSKCHVDATESDIEAILYNLLSNAIKYNKSNGKVFISCFEWRQQVIINIADQGSGFDLEKTIRKNSLRSDKTQTSIAKPDLTVSSGYGLELVKQSVSLLNGKMKVKSRKGMGSVISVILPRSIATSKTTEIEATHQSTNNNRTEHRKLIYSQTGLPDDKPMLFIVEDNDELREYLCEMFNNQYQCTPFPDAESAYLHASEVIPNIIISDVMLPGMSGIDLCQNIKSNQKTCHIPLLLLTAKADQTSIISGLRHQATDYLTKPFNTEELKLRVANLLSLATQMYQANQKVSLKHLYTNEDNSPEGLGEKDRLFMHRFFDVLAVNYSDSFYNLEQLSSHMYMSKKQLSRKLKAICNKSPMEYLKEYRLERSIELLAKGAQLSDISIESGFSSQSYYSTCFKNYFGRTPKQLQISILNDKRQTSKAS
ncbi:hybrid sensor histidine kinase/response regulator transcription factor [Aliikangiella coralliicola]|uniref:histidine kinase n=1 Tax=Aliikangiella coralliicola TaxID=2592383 RepID=A0A545TW69_9GAMM|nr:two-component regulator propeller domain-containing protein [Aliikangiella coralliicola]TQV81444.1 response regulator [Aliikangiella coralliicola]